MTLKASEKHLIEMHRSQIIVCAVVMLLAFAAGQVIYTLSSSYLAARAICKFVSSLCPVILALIACRLARNEVCRIMFFSLVLCLFGDVLINIVPVLGCALFALAHVGFVFAYIRHKGFAKSQVRLFAILAIAAGLILLAFFPFVGPIALAVIPYAAVLALVVAAALPMPSLIRIGALVFVISDVLLAVRIAVGSTPLFLGLTLFPYYVGLFLISVGMIAHGRGLESRPR